jgi:hypothetical protein
VPFVTRHAQYDVKVWYVPWDGGKSGARKGVHGGSVLECLCCGLWRRKREKGSRQVLWPLAEEATLQDSKCRCSTGTSYAVVFLLSFTIDKRPFGARAFDSLVFLLGLKFARLEVGNVFEAHVLLELSFE